MNTKHDELTGGERRYLEHERRAREKGLALSQYCRSIGLSAYSLYSMRRQMREKGILVPAEPATKRSAGAAQGQPAGATAVARRFVAVRVGEPAAAPSSPAGMVCRLRHASGWLIECGAWPPASWLGEIMREAGDVGA